MKVAICSSDGTKVDLHFGQTSTFYIFNFEGGEKRAIALREVEKYSPIQAEVLEGTIQHPFLSEKFELIYNSIKDCDKMYTTSIGDAPRKKLEEKGISVELCMCAIDWIPADDSKSDSTKIKYYLS